MNTCRFEGKAKITVIVFMIFLSACSNQEHILPTPTVVTTVIATKNRSDSILPPHPTTDVLSPAPNATERALEVAKGNCYVTPGFESITSPDGLWFAASCDVEYLRIARFDGTQSREYDFDQIVGEHFRITYKDRFGDIREFPPLLIVQHWHKDSRYLFVSASFVIDGSMQDGFGLYRLDVQTGKIETVLPIANSPYSFAFSPNYEYYVYTGEPDNNAIHVVSIESGEDVSYKVPRQTTILQKFLWSPDSNKLVFVDGFLFGENVTTSLLLFDLTEKKFAILLGNSEKRLVPVGWSSNDEIVLQSYSDGPGYSENTNTLELKEIPHP